MNQVQINVFIMLINILEWFVEKKKKIPKLKPKKVVKKEPPSCPSTPVPTPQPIQKSVLRW